MMNQRVVSYEVQDVLGVQGRAPSLDPLPRPLSRQGVASPCLAPVLRRVYSESNFQRGFVVQREVSECVSCQRPSQECAAWYPLSPTPPPAAPPASTPLLCQALYLPPSYVLLNAPSPASPPPRQPHSVDFVSSAATMFTMAGSPREGAGRCGTPTPMATPTACWSPAPHLQPQPQPHTSSCSCTRVSPVRPAVCYPFSPPNPSPWPTPPPRPELPATPSSPLYRRSSDPLAEGWPALPQPPSSPKLPQLRTRSYSTHLPPRPSDLEGELPQPGEDIRRQRKPSSPLLCYSSPQLGRRAQAPCGWVGEVPPQRVSPTPPPHHPRPLSAEVFCQHPQEAADTHGHGRCDSPQSIDSAGRRRPDTWPCKAVPGPVPIIQLPSSPESQRCASLGHSSDSLRSTDSTTARHRLQFPLSPDSLRRTSLGRSSCDSLRSDSPGMQRRPFPASPDSLRHASLGRSSDSPRSDSPTTRRRDSGQPDPAGRGLSAPVPIIHLHSSSSTGEDSLSNTSSLPSLPSSVCLCSACQDQGSPPSPQKSPRKNWSLRKFLLDRMLASSPYSSTGSRGSSADMYGPAAALSCPRGDARI
ncbi:nascent polypeptide-associated complex subunit alpha, muscle-specific form-like [Eriocheir sinensis]|uniref:nascent polypeptide-associated complex subunit alpha, muscle-specific form-like n=1 Tax=Eriocheir sinensis TaxID=95602 RepID=UPI0021C6F1E2|nr:nascent polypeptide-associated complex subunit alpha, muscle-specific form-like [Eriocheir sinensis]